MLSAPLTSWLLVEVSDERAIEVIAKSDLLRGEAAMKLPELRQMALRPATHEEIRDIFRTREQTFGDLRVPRTEGEWALFYADHFDALEGLTAAQIEGGMRAHIADPENRGFSPSPGRLADLARKANTAGRWTKAHNRARAAVERSREGQRPPETEAPRPSREEVAALLAPVLEALAGVDAKRKAQAKPRRPTPSAMVDGSGTSSEMRQLWQRQGYNPHPAHTEAEGKAA